MGSQRLLKALFILVFSFALLNCVSFSYGIAIVRDVACRTPVKPPPVDCVYQCKCECCPATLPGVMTLSDALNPREGEKYFQCKTYIHMFDTDKKWPRVNISTQPTKAPFQPFNVGDVPFFETSATCNQGGDRACCGRTCIDWYSGTEKPIYDEWGVISGYSTVCKKYLYEPKGDGYVYIYKNIWTAQTLPYSSMCAPVHSEIPRDSADADIQCNYYQADFDRVCNIYFSDPLVGPFGNCEIKVTDPVQLPCPDCAVFCAAEIAAGTIVCPP